MPSGKQIDWNRASSNFSPVYGGHYDNGTLYNETVHGRWWGSESYNGARRYNLDYYTGGLYTSDGTLRRSGIYIRCVSEEKTVTDLTYMQDMTPTLADAEAFI